ncbi:MAG: right-handed parallel beta-helix repeat-containing protein [Bacteroidales bacterium]|nr:right-handed parallel beta-helix repeat-containing protein [Bacteroidales bacterium]
MKPNTMSRSNQPLQLCGRSCWFVLNSFKIDNARRGGKHMVGLLVWLMLVFSGNLMAETYFVATDGDDANSGTIDNPFATFGHAISLVNAGDTIYVRGGTYMLDAPIVIDKAGTEDHYICLWAYEHESPIIDCGNNPRHGNPPQPRDDDSIEATSDALGVFVAPESDWWHIKGLTIQDAPYYGVRVYASHNIFEEMVLRDNQAAGLEITGKEGHVPSHNTVLNCDSYLNFDPQTNGEDADGFAAKFESLGPGNVFIGLRAWSNSDDGYDFWHATHPVLLDKCWSFDNGFFRPEWEPEVNGSWRGDGLGFKLGQDASELILHRDVAFGNKAYGIHDNGNNSPGGVTIYNATLVNNAKNGNPTQIQLNDGSPHTTRNTVAFDVDGSDVTILGGEVDDAYNTWNGIGVSANDFVSIDMDTLYAQGTAPRNPDGSLPELGLQLSPSSDLIDAGIDVGLPYYGEAPDLGAFERDITSVDEGSFVSKTSPFNLEVEPNPFIDEATIRFEIQQAADISIEIRNTSGLLIQQLKERSISPEKHTIPWNGLNETGEQVPAGLYFIHIQSNGEKAVKKILKL